MNPQRVVEINTCPPCDLFVQKWFWKRTPWQRMKTRYIMCVFKRKVSRCQTSFLCAEKRGLTYKCSLLEWPAAFFIHHKSLQVSPAVILGWLSSILLSVEQFSIFILLVPRGSFFPKHYSGTEGDSPHVLCSCCISDCLNVLFGTWSCLFGTLTRVSAGCHAWPMGIWQLWSDTSIICASQLIRGSFLLFQRAQSPVGVSALYQQSSSCQLGLIAFVLSLKGCQQWRWTCVLPETLLLFIGIPYLRLLLSLFCLPLLHFPSVHHHGSSVRCTCWS